MVKKTIKPAGGGDFANLQDWWDNFASLQTTPDIYQAECYEGDCGHINMSGAGFATTGSAYFEIYGFNGHNGELEPNLPTIRQVLSAPSFTRVHDIYYENTGAEELIIFGSQNLKIYNNLFYQTSDNNCIRAVGSATGDIYNNIFYLTNASTTNNYHAINLAPGTFSNYDGVVANNTCYSKNSSCLGIYTNVSGIHADFFNNIFITENVNDSYFNNGGGGDWLVTSSNNIYNRGAVLLNDTSTILTASAANEFINPDSNWNLKSIAQAIDAGITIGSFSYDGINITRPQGSAWDIGALEFIGQPQPDEDYFNAVIVDGPLAYYRHDDPVQSAAMSDSSGNDHHGLHLAVQLGASGLIRDDPSPCGIYLHGSFSTFGDILLPNVSQAWTFEFWMSANDLFENKIFSFNRDYFSFIVMSSDSGKGRFTIGNQFIDSLQPLEKNKKYHVVCIFNSGIAELYINAELQGSIETVAQLWRILEITGPFRDDDSALITTGQMLILEDDWVTASSEEQLIRIYVEGTAIVNSNPPTSFEWPESPAFRYNSEMHRIYIEDLFGNPQSDEDYDDSWWEIEIQRANYETGGNKIGINYFGKLDEFAIYAHDLPENRIIKHWEIGRGDDLNNATEDHLILSDSVELANIFERSIEDTLVFDDFSGHLRRLNEAILIFDNVLLQANTTQRITEVMVLLDLVQVEHTFQGGFVAQLGEILRINDSTTGDSSKSLHDSLNLSDQVDTPGLHFPNVIQTLNLQDSVIFEIPGAIFQFLSDRLFFQDHASPDAPVKRVFAKDVLTLTDSAQSNLKIFFLKDTLNFVDSTRHNYHVINLQDQLNFNEKVSPGLFVESLAELLVLTESVRHNMHFPILTDTIALTDRADVISNHQKLQDTLILSDSASGGFAVNNQSLEENLTLTDFTDFRPAPITFAFSDILTFQDQVSLTNELELEDTLTLQDSVYRVYPEFLEDELELDDLLEGFSTKELSDFLDIFDDVCVCFLGNNNVADTLIFVDSVRFLINDPTDPRNGPPPISPRPNWTIKAIHNRYLFDFLAIKDKLEEPIRPGCCPVDMHEGLMLIDSVLVEHIPGV